MFFDRLPDAARLLEAAPAKFVFSENIPKLVLTGLLSMVPTFEGRYAVEVMLGMGMPALPAYFFALICSTIPMPIILLLLRPVLDWFYTLPIAPIRKFAAWLEARAQNKRKKMMESRGLQGKLKGRFSQETLELIGLYIFVALPLPGTGVWTGSLIATVFELPRKKAALAIFLGNVTACAIMTLIGVGAKAVL